MWIRLNAKVSKESMPWQMVKGLNSKNPSPMNKLMSKHQVLVNNFLWKGT
jgi:hypothetical protein